MAADALRLPSREEMRRHIISSFRRYWPKEEHDAALAALPVHEQQCVSPTLPPLPLAVRLPDWAADCGVAGTLLIPSEACPNQEAPRWQDVDWWIAAFLLLEAWHERLHERERGSVHSYSIRLKGWDGRIWDHAWANRIALFLRRWSARYNARTEPELFEPLPEAEFLVTHDVDAVEKTGAIRLKQTLFIGFNALRRLVRGDWKTGCSHIKRAFRFLLTGSSWWLFDDILALEYARNIRCFNFFADERVPSLKHRLFDPCYNLAGARFRQLFAELRTKNFIIGLHPSFDSWNSAELMKTQRLRLEGVCGAPVRISRQHWLRFAWGSTLNALEKAGIELDTTLMFNDRPGFRASSAALRWKPFDHERGDNYAMEVLPSVLMDSHFYDYNPMTDKARCQSIAYWIREVWAVGGRSPCSGTPAEPRLRLEKRLSGASRLPSREGV